ncbi:MAG: DUF2493 domain-containing protein [Planctomycetales bacterium]|nr:DUF2493 domain-containing protein [Planctomycetales bacterium]
MKVIISGSRSIDRLSSRRWDYAKLGERIEIAVAASGFEITEVITGGAGGPDRAGELWAAEHGIAVSTFKPNWRLGKGAALIANRQLATEGEALIALYDGLSKGTLDMIELMRAAGMPVYEHRVSLGE